MVTMRLRLKFFGGLWASLILLGCEAPTATNFYHSIPSEEDNATAKIINANRRQIGERTCSKLIGKYEAGGLSDIDTDLCRELERLRNAITDMGRGINFIDIVSDYASEQEGPQGPQGPVGERGVVGPPGNTQINEMVQPILCLNDQDMCFLDPRYTFRVDSLVIGKYNPYCDYPEYGFMSVDPESKNCMESKGSVVFGSNNHSYESNAGSSILGGRKNKISASYASILGGESNQIEKNASKSVIYGGMGNVAHSVSSSIVGGLYNTVGRKNGRSKLVTILGGAMNEASADFSSIIGGHYTVKEPTRNVSSMAVLGDGISAGVMSDTHIKTHFMVDFNLQYILFLSDVSFKPESSITSLLSQLLEGKNVLSTSRLETVFAKDLYMHYAPPYNLAGPFTSKAAYSHATKLNLKSHQILNLSTFK